MSSGESTTLCSCRTTIVSADPERGLEGQGERRIRLTMDRLVIEKALAVRAQICFQCGDEENGEPIELQLPFTANNDTSEPWIITADMFQLLNAEGREQQQVTPGEGPADVVIANVSPNGFARFTTLVHLVGSAGKDDESVHGTYLLRVEDGGEVLLERHVRLGTFNQLWQVTRLILTVTVTLAAV
ncbi:MAG: hypothetical protein GY711_30280 [bacterium]|nr:hypothetical protein [bacterium]